MGGNTAIEAQKQGPGRSGCGRRRTSTDEDSHLPPKNGRAPLPPPFCKSRNPARSQLGQLKHKNTDYKVYYKKFYFNWQFMPLRLAGSRVTIAAPFFKLRAYSAASMINSPVERSHRAAGTGVQPGCTPTPRLLCKSACTRAGRTTTDSTTNNTRTVTMPMSSDERKEN